MQDYLMYQIGAALVRDKVCKVPYDQIVTALTPAYFPEHYRFGGVAHPGTSPGKIFGPTMFVAVDVGVYNGFSDHTVGQNEIVLFTSSDGGNWDKWVVVSDCCDDINYPVEPTPPTPPTPGPDPTQPLTFEILEAGNILWKFMQDDGNTQTIEYQKNGGEWTAISSTLEGAEIAVVAGDILRFRGNNWPGIDYCYFGSDCRFNAVGNPSSLKYGDNLTGEEALDDYCLSYLFYECAGLISANIALPAMSLTEECYASMFNGCTGLTTAPELPATTLATSCYNSMFRGCTSLTTAPELPATTLAMACYAGMFDNCTSLATAPELPATTLAMACYDAMFNGCTGLTTAPELPATTLATSCYNSMFNNCASLAEIRCLAEELLDGAGTQEWVNNVAAAGTFTKKTGVTWPSGASGIPSGWTVVEV